MKTPEIAERGAEGQLSDRRLYMQFLAFGGCTDLQALIGALSGAGIEGALYEDLHEPRGVGVVVIGEEPEIFIDCARCFQREPFAALAVRSGYRMFGRTYSLGYEPDLEEALRRRPRRNVLNADWPWAIWYPLRRSGAFALLPVEKQREILKEHGAIGMAFGRADMAHDVRLACHGLDPADNDFVIGLTGRELAPLSKLVETMRRTRQTAEFIERLGPFFVGRAVWQSVF